MSWKKVQVSTPITNELATVISSLSSITNTLSSLFTAITVLLEIAKAFIVGTIEPFVALVDAIITELETLINDLFATGFYMLTVNPFEITNSKGLLDIAQERKRLRDEKDAANAQFKLETKELELQQFDANPSENVDIKSKLAGVEERKALKTSSINNQLAQLDLTRADYGFDSFGIPILTPRNCILEAVNSFDDLGDVNRPIFSNAVEVSAIGFMATAPGLDQFKSIIEEFIKVFEIPDWSLSLYRFNEISSVTVPSVLPDWKSVRLNSFSPMDQVQKTLIGILETVKGFQITADDSLQDLIDIMKARAEHLDKISNDLNDLANAIQKATGVFTLNIPIGVGGTERIKAELRDTFLECQKNQYTIMTMFLGGGPGAAQAVDTLRGLFLGE